MDRKEMEIFNTKIRIIERAEKMGICKGTRITEVLDLENAIKQFDMRLADWVSADDVDFAHDFIGIQANINRTTGRIENLFVPRFAAEKGNTTRADKMAYIANTVMCMVNRFIRQPIKITYRKETDESVNDYTDFARKYHGILSGQEYFYVWKGDLLYAVNVTADSCLTAADELMHVLAHKF